MLEVIEDSRTLQTHNPLEPSPEGAKIQAPPMIIQKGTKLFYSHSVKQAKHNLTGDEIHFYEIAKGHWVSDTNKSGRPVLQKRVRLVFCANLRPPTAHEMQP